jgi:hypothetical protein
MCGRRFSYVLRGHLPVLLVIDIETRRQGAVRVGVGVFAAPASSPSCGGRPRPGILALTGRDPGALELLGRVRFPGSLDLCAGDAALTALIAGAGRRCRWAACARFRFFLRARPCALSRDVTLKPGHIMLAPRLGAARNFPGGSTRGKASTEIIMNATMENIREVDVNTVSATR